MITSKPVLLLAVAGLLSVPSFGQTKKTTTDENVGTAKVAGMQVAIDKRTGRLRQPTPEERAKLAKALRASLNRSAEGLQVTRYPNGMQSVDLQGRFQSVSVAKVNEDGKVEERCLTNKREADAFLANKTKKKQSKNTAEVK